MAITYTKMFRCSENFPAEYGQEWNVREGRKVAEHWRVIRRGKASFEVEITEFIPAS